MKHQTDEYAFFLKDGDFITTQARDVLKAYNFLRCTSKVRVSLDEIVSVYHTGVDNSTNPPTLIKFGLDLLPMLKRRIAESKKG